MKTNILWQEKFYDNLTLEELYKILRVRQQVFVVEQQCFYLDLDNKDNHSLHLMGYHNQDLVTYLRIIFPLDTEKTLRIGRVLTTLPWRKKGLARELMQRALAIIARDYSNYTIVLAAQVHLQSFYESFDFITTSEPYDEDGIMHIDMRKK